MITVNFLTACPPMEFPDNTSGIEVLRQICRLRTDDGHYSNTADKCIISGATFSAEDGPYIIDFHGTEFSKCVFNNANFNNCEFCDCKATKCKFKYDDPAQANWITRAGFSTVGVKMPAILKPENDEIARKYGVKVTALPNKSFVKVAWTCDFCHRTFSIIARRDRVGSALNDRKNVPNCDKHVCCGCYDSYRLVDKFEGHRHYGYSGPVVKHTTEMDASNTTLLGLEMEFEGDFVGWKELQDAHKGQLHYGYDSSVVGQNELSWDCGSYSWWKYLSSLTDVCAALSKNGGHAGDSAGIHIHASRPDVNVMETTSRINAACADGVWRAIMEAVSLRNNKTLFERYANLSSTMDAHHAGISFNGHGTCEFRIFNSSLDPRLILSRLKFCKEVFNLFAEKKSSETLESLVKKLSKESLTLIKKCAKEQLDKRFIGTATYDLIMRSI